MQIKNQIRIFLQSLMCETHPQTCALRDQNYNQIENLVMEYLEKNPTHSVATAVAFIESEILE